MKDSVKDYQNLIGKLLIAAAIIIAANMISQAIQVAGGAIGSQIASAIATFI